MFIRKNANDKLSTAIVAKNKEDSPISKDQFLTTTGAGKAMAYPNGDSYIGDVKKGRRCGQGTYAFADNLVMQLKRLDKATLTEKGTHHAQGTTVFTGRGDPVNERRCGSNQWVAYRRPDEEFQASKIIGRWKDDDLLSGSMTVFNRQGSCKEFSVSGADLNLIASTAVGQHLTVRRWQGDQGKPIRLNAEKEKGWLDDSSDED